MRFYSKIFMVLAVIIGLVACDKGFEEVNSNPNDPLAVPSKLMMPDITRISMNVLYSTFTGGDMGACWAQQWAKVQYNDEARYIPRSSVITSNWETYYASVISDAKVMQGLAEEEENSNMQGVALVLQAFGFQVMTDMFGDVPFSEALQAKDGNFTPIYDSQEDVYVGILALLDEADSKLNGSGEIDAISDILYGGDYTGWKKLANSLKFRALMRISGKVNVSAELQDIVNNRMVFTSNADEGGLTYLAAEPNANPIWETVVMGGRAEWKVNSEIVDMLTSLNDPRLPVYAAPNTDGNIVGKPSGFRDLPSDDYGYANISGLGSLYLDPTLKGYFMSYSELQFLMAEAASKGYISGSAAAFYEEAIRANFEFNGVLGDYSTYISQPSVAFNTANAMQQISEQKWIALFGQGFEAWTEWRRTGFPVLSPAAESDLGEIPSRYTYPVIEQSLNSTNYGNAVSSQGPDALTTRLWWMN